MSNRRDFITKMALGSAAATITPSAMAMTAKSYRKIVGANDRLQIGIIGLGRRLGAFTDPIARKEANVELTYLCDVMESQRSKAMERFSKLIDYKPKLENDIRKVIEDQQVDAIINATPDHWHAPGAIMALQGGKHVYVEKPGTHNMHENELLLEAIKKYGKKVQMGVQQRSSDHTQEIVAEIHNGIIGTPYKAVAFYTNNRGEVPLQKPAPVPEGLDWELFQGPAPRRDYTEETWNYNWHWYGWDYGTAESGNNGTHEFDVARWALGVDYPTHAKVEGGKYHFVDDGWEMYDTIEAIFNFGPDKTIVWDGKSRNGYDTYGGGRGTIIYGSEGTVFVDRGMYKLTDRDGKVIKESQSGSDEAGTALGGGGGMSTVHVMNFFDAIRGKAELNAPFEEGAITMGMVHYTNIAYRLGSGFDIDPATGKIKDEKAMQYWGRDYASGWEPNV